MRYILNVFAGNLSLSTVPPLRLWHEAADSTGRTASGWSRVFSASMSSLCRVVSVAECEPRSPLRLSVRSCASSDVLTTLTTISPFCQSTTALAKSPS